MLAERRASGCVDGFGRAGSPVAAAMIGFIKESGIRCFFFEINTCAAEQAGLKGSSKLLQVGKRVSGEAPAQGNG